MATIRPCTSPTAWFGLAPSRPGLRGRRRRRQANIIVQSLNGFSSTAHISGMGLKVMLMIMPFSDLCAVNLYGIVHISSRSLPMGLYSLNLSPKKIANVKRLLRKLTKLRALNLSYNRISRIGRVRTSSPTLPTYPLPPGQARLQRRNLPSIIALPFTPEGQPHTSPVRRALVGSGSDLAMWVKFEPRKEVEHDLRCSIHDARIISWQGRGGSWCGSSMGGASQFGTS